MEEPERFATVGEDAIDKLLSDKNSNNTKKSTKVSIGILEGYLSEKFISLPLSQWTSS